MKILWCGGSHLACAKSSILKIYAESDNSFFITAGGKVKIWSLNGGRYKVNKSVVGGNCWRKKSFDLNSFDFIIFVGQYIHAGRYFDTDMPCSDDLVECIVNDKNFLKYIPFSDSFFFNEPLVLFPSIVPSKCILIPDPMPSNSKLSEHIVKKFNHAVQDFCKENNLLYFPQVEKTKVDYVSTNPIYLKDPKDKNHMNEDYWCIQLNKLKSDIS